MTLISTATEKKRRIRLLVFNSCHQMTYKLSYIMMENLGFAISSRDYVGRGEDGRQGREALSHFLPRKPS